MGLWTRAVLARWVARWLLRGSPATVVAKLLAVGALGAWRYRRKRRRERAADPRQLEADYEVLGPERIAPGGRPREPRRGAQGTRSEEVDADPTRPTHNS